MRQADRTRMSRRTGRLLPPSENYAEKRWRERETTGLVSKEPKKIRNRPFVLGEGGASGWVNLRRAGRARRFISEPGAHWVALCTFVRCDGVSWASSVVVGSAALNLKMATFSRGRNALASHRACRRYEAVCFHATSSGRRSMAAMRVATRNANRGPHALADDSHPILLRHRSDEHTRRSRGI